MKGRTFPKSDLATYGYWAAPVQKVVKKWRNRIGEKWCKHYTLPCFYAVFYADDINVKLEGKGHQGFVIDLLAAFETLNQDRQSPVPWVLEHCSTGAADYDFHSTFPRPYTVENMRDIIERCSGEVFTLDVISKCLTRLRLNKS